MSGAKRLPSHLDPRRAWVPFLVVAGVVLTLAFVLINPASAAVLPFGVRAVFWALRIFPALALLQAAQRSLTALPGYGRGSMWI
ncbi:MAG: hypothetical protein AAF214_10770 [Pseudomonadota bacterium]